MFSINNFFNTDKEKRFYSPTAVIQKGFSKSLLVNLLNTELPTVIVHDSFVEPSDFLDLFLNVSVPSEPTEEMVLNALKKIPWDRFNLVAVGGGSTIDLAKCLLSHKLFGDWKRVGYGDARYISDNTANSSIIFVSIPTTPASGSEVSRYFLIKDHETHQKIVSRSWLVCPKYALLDPTLLTTLPTTRLIVSLFDAFVHCWETYICKYESSDIIRLLAAYGMSQILKFVDKVKGGERPSIEMLASVQLAATIGGICLSNTRTGFLHTAGEALSAQISLPHPHTLKIFFESCLNHYKNEIADLFSEMCAGFPTHLSTVDSIIQFWNSVWGAFDLDREISNLSRGSLVDLSSLIEIVERDKVLLEKEHPSEFKYGDLLSIIMCSLDRYCIEYTTSRG